MSEWVDIWLFGVVYENKTLSICPSALRAITGAGALHGAGASWPGEVDHDFTEGTAGRQR